MNQPIEETSALFSTTIGMFEITPEAYEGCVDIALQDAFSGYITYITIGGFPILLISGFVLNLCIDCTHKENKDKGTSSTMITKVLMDVNPKWEKYVVEFQVRASRRSSGSNLRLISDTPLTFVQMCLRVAGQRHCPLTALTPQIRTVRHLSRWSRSRLGHVAPPPLPVLHLDDDTWHALLTYYPW